MVFPGLSSGGWVGEGGGGIDKQHIVQPFCAFFFFFIITHCIIARIVYTTEEM